MFFFLFFVFWKEHHIIITLLYFFSLNKKWIPNQTLLLAKVAFLEDNSAFVSYILSLFDKWCLIFNRIRKVVDLDRNSRHQCFLCFRCKIIQNGTGTAQGVKLGGFSPAPPPPPLLFWQVVLEHWMFNWKYLKCWWRTENLPVLMTF